MYDLGTYFLGLTCTRRRADPAQHHCEGEMGGLWNGVEFRVLKGCLPLLLYCM